MEHALLREARAMAPFLEEIFCALHREPELGKAEHRTAQRIRRELEAMGLEPVTIADTGVMAVIRGGQEGPTIGFRADMDALPITEETGLPYASQYPGVMHACGHDFHVAALLGAARLLLERRGELRGNVKLFFQPDEEKDGGAARMIAAGCMTDPPVDAMIACHVDSTTPTGKVSLRPGPICAASNPFTITVRGVGSHGAKPHLGTDVIVAGSHMVTALQTIASRRSSPTEPVVVTVGSFHAGTAGNILPGEAVLTGTIRTMGSEARQKVTEDVSAIVTGVAAAMDVAVDIHIEESYPSCVNDRAMTDLLRRSAEELLGSENVLDRDHPSMGADDFGYFSAAVPGCYYYLGVGNVGKGFAYPNHNSCFAADPAALPVAAALHAKVVLDYLGREDVP